MAGYNRLVMIGNLTRDPEYKQLPSGQGVCKLGIASNRQYKNRQTGNMVQEVCFIDIEVYGQQAETCKQYLQKGRSILVEGRIKFDSWESADGEKRSKHSVIADRVIFLNSGNNATDSDRLEDAVTNNASSQELAPEFFGARPTATQAKREVNKKIKPSTSPFDDVVGMQDEPPFQDELPF